MDPVGIALYATICLWSPDGAPMCREMPLTPGVAGPLFDSTDSCVKEQEDAFNRWYAYAAPVFGFSGIQGYGYEIKALRCGPFNH
jgi:hypothetical protein